MATVVIMPRQGQSVESCVITSWNKQKGDKVAAGDILFSYETDKSSFEEKSEVDGILLEMLAAEGDDVPCLDPVCIIGEEGEDISDLIPKKEVAESAAQPEAAPAAAPAGDDLQAAVKPAAEAPAAAVTDGFTRISPRAKNLAAKTGADLSKAAPTGPMGRIIERDINALLDKGYLVKAASAEASAPAAPADIPAFVAPEAEYEDVKLTNIRKVIAKAMHASLADMAQLTLNSSFDATRILEYRARLKAGAEALGMPNITLNDMVLFAAAKILPEHKDLNAHYLGGEDKIRRFTHVHMGVAVDTDRGLIVPTLFNADTLTLSELAKDSRELITQAQSGTINPDKLRGASFTVTNLGALGIESFTPVINPPQTGILGVNNIIRRVKEEGGKDVFYPAMGLSLTFDHRAVDGAPAARFLKALCEALEAFDLLMAK